MAYKQAQRIYIGILGEYEGSINLSVHPSSLCDWIPHYHGELAVSITPQSASVQDFAYTGEITTEISFASIYFGCHADSPCYEGDLSVSIQPQSTYNQVYNYTGSISVSIAPSSESDRDRFYDGSITVNIEPKSRYARVTHIGWDIYTGWGLADCSFLQQPPPFYIIESLLKFKLNPAADDIRLIKVFKREVNANARIEVESEYSIKYPPVYSHETDLNIVASVTSDVKTKYPSKHEATCVVRLVCRPSTIVEFKLPKDRILQHTTEITSYVSSVNKVVFKKPKALNISSICSLVVEPKANVVTKKDGDFIYKHASDVTLIATVKSEFRSPHVTKIYRHPSTCKLSLSVASTEIHVKPRTYGHNSIVKLIIGIGFAEDALLNTFAFTNNATKMSVFSNYNFTSYAISPYSGVCYATGTDGIYELDTSNSDNGRRIYSGVVIKTNDLGTLAYKKIRYVDIGSAGAKLVKVACSNNGDGIFDVERCGKAYVDKTIEGKELELAIEGFDEMSQFELFVLPTNRR